MSHMQGKNKSLRRQLALLEKTIVPETEAAVAEEVDAYDLVTAGISEAIHAKFGRGASRIADGFLTEAKEPFLAEIGRRQLARAEQLRAEFSKARTELAGGANPDSVSQSLTEDEEAWEAEFASWLAEHEENFFQRLWNRLSDVVAATWEAVKSVLASWWERLTAALKPKTPALSVPL